MAISPTSSTSPLLRSSSEVALATLHLEFSTGPAPLPHHARHASQISDEDLESLFPPLGKSVVEEREEDDHALAIRALDALHVKTPDVDAGARYSPYDAATPPPDSSENPYFQSASHLYAIPSFQRAYSSSSSRSSSCHSSSSHSSDASFGPTTPPSLSPQNLSALAASRISPANLKIAPPGPSRADQAPSTTNGFLLSDGVLKGNFGGFSSGVKESLCIDGPLSVPLKLKRKPSGFAF